MPSPLISHFPTVVVEIAFATNPGATPTWVDVSSYLRSFSIRRGRSHELGRMEAGTARLRLSNRDRRFDPSYTSGPYYPNVLPLRRVRIRATWSAVTYELFNGYIERWPQQWQGTKDAYVDLDATDGFEPLNQLAFASVGTRAQEFSGARVGYVLDQAGWPAADRSIDAGQSQIVAQDFDNYGALAHLQEVANSEQGVLFMSADGKATFHDRHHRFKAPYTTSQGTFGDGTGELPYADLTLAFEKDEIRNDVTVTREGGTAQNVQDATSISRYFKRSLSLTPKVTTDAEALSQAQFLVSRYKEPAVRIREIELAGRMSDSLYPHLLGRELGDRITVKRRPPGGGTISQDCHVEQIATDVAKKGDSWEWKVRWGLSPAEQTNYWALGDSVNGVLGTTTRLSY